MCYKKEDYIDEFSVQSVDSFDYNFPDSHPGFTQTHPPRWQDKPMRYKASNSDELHDPDSHWAGPSHPPSSFSGQPGPARSVLLEGGEERQRGLSHPTPPTPAHGPGPWPVCWVLGTAP